MRKYLFLASVMGIAAFASSSSFAATAQAGLSNKQCHQAFQAAKASNSLNGQNYDAFKATNCAAKVASSSAVTSDSANNAKTSDMPTGKVIFPESIPSQFAALPAGKARMKACVAQYNMNKANGSNGGLKWVQKGGGYWSQCNQHLKAVTSSTK